MEREKLGKQILEVLKKHLPLEDCIVILYGSLALGKETPTSDIDLLIDCLNPIGDWEFLELQEALNTEIDTPRKVNPVGMKTLSEDFLHFALQGAVIQYVGKNYLRRWLNRWNVHRD